MMHSKFTRGRQGAGDGIRESAGQDLKPKRDCRSMEGVF